MAKRSKVLVEVEASTISTETIGASNGNNNNKVTFPFWESIKMADFRFAMRSFINGSENGIALSWRGLVCKLLALKDGESDKQVFITLFESNEQGYKVTDRIRVILSENGIGYSLCRVLEALDGKEPRGTFVRVDIRDTISVSETLTLLRERFPKLNKPTQD